MRRLTPLLLIACIAALTVCGVDWYLSSRAPEWDRFSYCYFSRGFNGTEMHLGYDYQSGQQVVPRIDIQESMVVVALEWLDDDEDSASNDMQASVWLVVGDAAQEPDVVYPDGQTMTCRTVDNGSY